jgi:hypothetical protein
VFVFSWKTFACRLNYDLRFASSFLWKELGDEITLGLFGEKEKKKISGG